MIESIPNVDGWIFVGMTALTFFTSAFGFVVGLGGGVLLLGVMATIFPPTALIPLHGFVQFGNSVTRAYLMRRYILWDAIAAATAGAVLGALIGGKIVVSLPTALLQGIMGAFLLYSALAPGFTAGKPTHKRFAVFGFAGTLVSMFVGAAGTLLAPFVAGCSPDRRVYIGTHSVLMTVIHGLKIVVFSFLGFAVAAYLPLIVAMVAAGTAGSFAGRYLINRISEELFRRMFQIVVTLLALRLVYLAVEKSGLI